MLDTRRNNFQLLYWVPTLNATMSRNIRYMRILAGVPLGGDLKWQWGCRPLQFLAIWVATSSETSKIRPAILAYTTICLLAC